MTRDHLHLVRGIRAVNQVISKRIVKKAADVLEPRGAHLLLQIRTRVLNDTLTDDYQRWYPTSPTQPIKSTWPRNLPRFVPLSTSDPSTTDTTSCHPSEQHPRGSLKRTHIHAGRPRK